MDPRDEKPTLAEAVIDKHLARRHLTESQRGMVAVKLANMPKGANQHAQICAPSQDEAAELFNVSRRIAPKPTLL